jgi:hypothetical protein
MRNPILAAPALTLALLAGPAAAHPGHIADVAGHDHWTLGAGLGAIAAAGVLAWIKGRRKDDAPETDGDVPEGESA